jgi:hypothetical protein
MHSFLCCRFQAWSSSTLPYSASVVVVVRRRAPMHPPFAISAVDFLGFWPLHPPSNKAVT